MRRPGSYGRLLLLGAALWLPASSQLRLTLEQAGSRNRPDYTPVYEGKEALVRGRISTKPVWSLDAFYLPIQDEAEYGLLLQGAAAQFSGLEPGDRVEVSGAIVRHAGMPVLVVRDIRVAEHASPPAPKELRLAQLNSFRYLGVLVTTQGRINSAGETSGGDVVSLAEKSIHLDAFLPKMRRNGTPGLQGYRPGDVVRATGIAMQYCTLAPYDRSYQVLLANPANLVLVEKAWLIAPSLLLTALIAILALLALWLLREHHMAALRRRSRVLNSLGEEVIGSATASEVVRKLVVVLSDMMNLSGVGIFVCNRQSQTLDSFSGEGSARDYVEMQPPGACILEPACTAFRNRTVLAIPDTRRSPLFQGPKGHVPRSVLFVPMFAQTELVGILEVENFDGVRHFTREEQAALQHLANQAAAALKLQEQQSIREQLFRTEKLAAAGQLMSGIANELRLPLEAIVNLATALRARNADDPYIRSLAVEARRASEIVQRLLSFSGPDTTEVEPVDVNEMLAEVANLHETALRSRNVSIRRRFTKESIVALGSREQLAQVILNLLIYAEQLLGEARGASELRIASGLLARRGLIEISWPARVSEAESERSAADLIEKTGLSLEVCRGIIHSHGGELRVSKTGNDIHFEIDLPLIEGKKRTEPEGSEERTVHRQLTALVVEPEAASQGHVVGVFTALGHRVVPVASAEEGADLAQRMRFDIAVCALRLTGLSWADFLERVRGMVSGVILLTDAYDPNLSRTFKSSDVFVLTKPADPSEIKNICTAIEECSDRAPASH